MILDENVMILKYYVYVSIKKENEVLPCSSTGTNPSSTEIYGRRGIEPNTGLNPFLKLR